MRFFVSIHNVFAVLLTVYRVSLSLTSQSLIEKQKRVWSNYVEAVVIVKQ